MRGHENAAETRDGLEARYIVGGDGAVLFVSRLGGRSGSPVAFVGHTQPTHTGTFDAHAGALHRAGLTVVRGDLRGHGRSVTARQRHAHLDPVTGWDDLLADFRALTAHAFDGIAWEDRLLVAPNISALLALDLLKSEPALARHIVLVSPPPNQPAKWRLGQAWTRARMLLKRADAPDEETLHTLYTFLGAHLKNRTHLSDVMSADPAAMRGFLADPLSWPTPTLGYWSAIFAGYRRAWDWPKRARMKAGTRVLVMHGSEDPMLGLGGYVTAITAWLAEAGAEDVAVHVVEGARTLMLLDEERLAPSSSILAWFRGETEHLVPDSAPDRDMRDVSLQILKRFGSGSASGELRPDELVELCYSAIDDEDRWIEMLYRLALRASDGAPVDEATLETVFASIMPHWDRSFAITRQIMRNAAIGVVLQDVLERLDLGMVLIDRDLGPLHANLAFRRFLVARGLAAGEEATADEIARAVRLLMPERPAPGGSSPRAEIPLRLGTETVGVFLKPEPLVQSGLQRGGPDGLVLVRHRSGERPAAADDDEARQTLLQLAYGLTRQEARVCALVATGRSPHRIARETGVSINTVRTHLRRAFEKTETQSQSELAARLLAGPVGWLST